MALGFEARTGIGAVGRKRIPSFREVHNDQCEWVGIMNRSIISLLAAITFVTASTAYGQAYSGVVLYPLTLPSGFYYSNDLWDASGNAVGYGYISPTSSYYNAMYWGGSASAVVN